MGLLSGCCLGLIAIFLPPLAVIARTGCDHHFIINILLTLLGWLPGVLHAWYIILRFPDGKHRSQPVRYHSHGHGPPPPPAGVYYPPPPQETGYRRY